MNYKGEVTSEFGVDHLLICYEVDQGELQITEVYIDGIPVEDSDTYGRVYAYAQQVAWDDYIGEYESRQEDYLVGRWESKIDAEADYD